MKFGVLAAVPAALLAASFFRAGSAAGQSPPQAPSTVAPTLEAYFPPGLAQGSIFRLILPALHEPSLMDAAKDKSVVSYRFSYFQGEPLLYVVVRLSVNADGSGQITTFLSRSLHHWSDALQSETKRDLSASDVAPFLGLVERTSFWDMPVEIWENKHYYILDGATWVIEGARKGSYRCVYRYQPSPGPFVEVGGFLAKVLAQISDSEFRPRGYVSPNP